MQLSYFASTLVQLCTLTICRAGDSKVTGPPTDQPMTVVAGDDVILLCSVTPSSSVVNLAVEWFRPDLNPKYVHLYRNTQELLDEQNTMYRYRTALFLRELQTGNISLMLHRVRLTDEGRYVCQVPSLTGQDKSASVELLVDVPEPKLSIVGSNASGVVLRCVSQGWTLEPEVDWSEELGSALQSKAVTEMAQGPNGLYTATSRITVKSTKSNSFICTVQQRTINKSAKAKIHVLEEFFHGSITTVILAVFLGLAVIIILCLLFWIWLRTQPKKTAAPDSIPMPERKPLNQNRNGLSGTDEHDGQQAEDNQEAIDQNRNDLSGTDEHDGQPADQNRNDLSGTDEHDGQPAEDNQEAIAAQVIDPLGGIASSEQPSSQSIVPVMSAAHRDPLEFKCTYQQTVTTQENLFTFKDPTRKGLMEQVSNFQKNSACSFYIPPADQQSSSHAPAPQPGVFHPAADDSDA